MNKLVKLILLVLGLIVMVLVLGIIFVNTWSHKQTDNPNSQTNHALKLKSYDTQRKNGVGAIWGAAQQYHQKTGNYPTNDIVNTESFQSEYNLSASTLRDPQGTSQAIVNRPSKGAYSYNPTALDGSPCDNVNKQCAGFKVVAILNDDGEYSLTESQ